MPRIQYISPWVISSNKSLFLMYSFKMLLLLLLASLIQLSMQQCLTAKDEIRKLNTAAHESLMRSELQFSTDLLQAAASLQPKDNLLLSPSSVFQASMLAYFISANQTEKNLRKVLHLASSYDKLELLGAFNMENYYQRLHALKSKSYELNNANALFVAKNLKIQYCLKGLFEEIRPVNFHKKPGKVVKMINEWVAKATRNVIKDFLPKDVVSKDAQLILVNAAYFKGKWVIPFDEQSTRIKNFKLSSGSQVKTTFMTQMGAFKYVVDKKIEAEVVELPYVGDDISMMILLPLRPSPSAVQDMLKRLNDNSVKSLVTTLTSSESAVPDLTVTIPKFTMESDLDLTAILESMGVGDLFQNSADFSILAPGLTFSKASHKAKITVDEKGTEAAAATSFIASRASFSDSFMADRPFLYMVYDKTTNIPLFFGVFNQPEPPAS